MGISSPGKTVLLFKILNCAAEKIRMPTLWSASRLAAPGRDFHKKIKLGIPTLWCGGEDSNADAVDTLLFRRRESNKHRLNFLKIITMTKKYTKKPTTVEAIQFTADNIAAVIQ